MIPDDKDEFVKGFLVFATIFSVFILFVIIAIEMGLL